MVHTLRRVALTLCESWSISDVTCAPISTEHCCRTQSSSALSWSLQGAAPGKCLKLCLWQWCNRSWIVQQGAAKAPNRHILVQTIPIISLIGASRCQRTTLDIRPLWRWKWSIFLQKINLGENRKDSNARVVIHCGMKEQLLYCYLYCLGSQKTIIHQRGSVGGVDQYQSLQYCLGGCRDFQASHKSSLVVLFRLAKIVDTHHEASSESLALNQPRAISETGLPWLLCASVSHQGALFQMLYNFF